MGSFSSPKTTEATSSEKAAEYEASKLWSDVKSRFWPLDEKIAQQVQNVDRGRAAREEAAVGAMPVGFNPFNKGQSVSQSLGLGAQSANRQTALRNNEHDRQMAGLANVIGTGREIQTSGLQDTTGAALRDTSQMLSRYDAKNAVNRAMIGELSQLGATAGMAYGMRQPSGTVPVKMGLTSDGVMQSGQNYAPQNSWSPTWR